MTRLFTFANKKKRKKKRKPGPQLLTIGSSGGESKRIVRNVARIVSRESKRAAKARKKLQRQQQKELMRQRAMEIAAKKREGREFRAFLKRKQRMALKRFGAA